MSKRWDFLLNMYIMAGFVSSVFHVPYWGYKYAQYDKHHELLSDLTAGGVKAYSISMGLVGILIGIGATTIWPVSTYLTRINIQERINNEDGFFFPCTRSSYLKGWNLKLSELMKKE